MPKDYLPPPESDSRVLIEFQRRVPSAEDAFIKRFGPFIENVARKRGDAHHLGQDDLEEITQETYRLLLDDTLTKYDATKCTPFQFVGGQVYNAARIIAAAYRNGPPRRDGQSVQEEVDLRDLDDLQAPAARDGIGAAEFRLLVADLGKGSDALTQQIFAIVHLEDAGIQEVADRLDLTRFQVHRRLRSIYARARSAFAA